MPEVVELRVHGVGGTPAEGLLGVADASDLVQVGGDTAAPFMARRDDPGVEGYVWGRLTSKGVLQPLWLLLLPFTLVNVAGWTHPPERDGRFGGWHPLPLLRFFVQLIGLGLTATYVLWLGNVAVNGLLGVETVLGVTPSRGAKIVVAAALLYLVVLAHLVVARKVQAGFEGFPGPGGRRPGTGETGPGVGQVISELGAPFTPRGVKALGASVGRADDLSSNGFWQRALESRVVLALHVLVGLAAATWVTVQSLIRADPVYLDALSATVRTDPTKANLQLGLLATGFTEGLLWTLAALGVLQLLGWRLWPRDRSEPRFRFLAPMTAAATGVGLGNGFLYGITVLVLHDRGRVEALGMAFGVATVAWVVGGVGLLLWLAASKRRHRREARATVPENTAEPGRALNGATPQMYDRIGWARAFSDAGRNGDVLMTLAQVVFIVVGLLELRGWLRLEDVRYVGGLATFGHLVALAATAAVLAFLVRRAYRPDQRRMVGILWDVLTFWPRRFHPLGVRPYAERAVPELQHRLVQHVDEADRMVVLSAHSQGTVIAYAALRQDGHVFDRVARRVALVTYGAPLWQLHAMAFPAYFHVEEFHKLRGRLFGGRAGDSPAWRNFYRQSDYIGKRVFGAPPLDTVVPDPAEAPAPPLPTWPDPQRTPWLDLAKHSFYNNEAQLKVWLGTLKAQLRRGPAARTKD